MGEVIEFKTKDKHPEIGYVIDESEVVGVSLRECIELLLDGTVSITSDNQVKLTQEELEQLMIMWLSLVDPAIINYDEC